MAALEEGVVPIDYSQHFWGEKHMGYHALYENLKRGEDTVQEFHLFLKERIGAEDDTHKQLQKSLQRINNYALSSSSSSSTTGGPLVEAWRLTKATTERWAQIQERLLTRLIELSREVAKYHDDLVRSRKRVKEDDVLEAVNLMQTTTTCLQKAKETYQQRCAETLAQLRSESSSSTLSGPSKDFLKSRQKLLKAHEEYRLYVEKFNRVRDTFEEKMLKATRSFQAHDLAHLEQVRRFFVQMAFELNERSKAMASVADEYQHSLSESLVEAAMRKFIGEKATGQDRPQPIRWSEADELPAELRQDPLERPPPSSVSQLVDTQANNFESFGGHNSTSAIVGDLLGGDWPQAESSSPIGPTSAAKNKASVPRGGGYLGRRRVSSEHKPQHKPCSSDDDDEEEDNEELKGFHGTRSYPQQATGDMASAGNVHMSSWMPPQQLLSSWLGKQRLGQWRKSRSSQHPQHHSSHSNLSLAAVAATAATAVGNEHKASGGGGGPLFDAMSAGHSEGGTGSIGSEGAPVGKGSSGGGGANFLRRYRRSKNESASSGSELAAHVGRKRHSIHAGSIGEADVMGAAAQLPPKVAVQDLLSLSGGDNRSTTSSSRSDEKSDPFTLGLGKWFSMSHSSTEHPQGWQHSFSPAPSASVGSAHPAAAANSRMGILHAEGGHNLKNPELAVQSAALSGASTPSGPASTAGGEDDDDSDEDGFGEGWDDSSFSTAKIKRMQIRPLNSEQVREGSNKSEELDVLRAAIGSLTLIPQQKTGELAQTDPWSPSSSRFGTLKLDSASGKPATNNPFSSSSRWGGASSSAAPMRAALTGDEHMRRAVHYPLDMSSSNLIHSAAAGETNAMASGSGIARARPRSHTPLVPFVPTDTNDVQPTQPQSSTTSTNISIKPQQGGDNENAAAQSSVFSSSFFSSTTFGSGSFTGSPNAGSNTLAQLSHAATFTSTPSRFMDAQKLQSQLSLSQLGESSQKVPVAMACNEYFHAWFKQRDKSPATKVLGSIVISLPVSALSQLLSSGNATADSLASGDELQVSLGACSAIKSVHPNRKLEVACAENEPQQSGKGHSLRVGRHHLGRWLAEQQRSKPESNFHNVDIARYELFDIVGVEPPLILASYWKTATDPASKQVQIDLRIDYRLNPQCELDYSGLANVTFITQLLPTGSSGKRVVGFQCQPDGAQLDEVGKVRWSLAEVSKLQGQSVGSLKARVRLEPVGDGGSRVSEIEPANTVVQFQISDLSVSNVEVSLDNNNDGFRLTMTRRKIMAGKYFCEPEIRH